MGGRVILAGAGDPSKLAAVSRMPIWAFHAADDSVIPVARMKELIAALRPLMDILAKPSFLTGITGPPGIKG